MPVNGIDYKVLTFLYFSDKNEIKFTRDPSLMNDNIIINKNNNRHETEKTIITYMSDIDIIEMPYFKKYFLEDDLDVFHMKYTRLREGYNLELICNNKYKLFIMKKKINNYNKTLYILSPFNNLDNEIGCYMNEFVNYVVDINNNIINGSVQIYKKNDIEFIDFFLQNIQIQGKSINFMARIESMSDIKYTYDMFDLYKFDIQKSYDEVIKTKYNFCIESNILNKSIYTSIFTDISITNNKEVSLLRDNFGYILEHIMITKLVRSKDNIMDICKNDIERHYILGNTMKRLNTTYKKDFMIKNSKNVFVDINSAGKIIFDTGNANLCIVGIDFLRKLGYGDKDFKPMPTTSTSGVGKGSIEYDKYIVLTLKINPEVKNISLNKEYTFIAFVGKETLQDTLLLGQSAHSLRQFFQDSYCIGYNTDRQEYEQKRLRARDELNKINQTLDILIDMHRHNIISRDVTAEYRKLINIHYLSVFLTIIDNNDDLILYENIIQKIRILKDLTSSGLNNQIYGNSFNIIFGNIKL
jgi:hypothetical protein